VNDAVRPDRTDDVAHLGRPQDVQVHATRHWLGVVRRYHFVLGQVQQLALQ
jgi:hypothetical protein